jgi:hypothetical protein
MPHTVIFLTFWEENFRILHKFCLPNLSRHTNYHVLSWTRDSNLCNQVSATNCLLCLSYKQTVRKYSYNQISHGHFHQNSSLFIDLDQETAIYYKTLQYLLSFILNLYMSMCQSQDNQLFIQAVRNLQRFCFTFSIPFNFLLGLVINNYHLARNSPLRKLKFQYLSQWRLFRDCGCVLLSYTWQLAKQWTLIVSRSNKWVDLFQNSSYNDTETTAVVHRVQNCGSKNIITAEESTARLSQLKSVLLLATCSSFCEKTSSDN